MKRLDECKKEELAALTNEEIKKLVELECAHRGIAIDTQTQALVEPNSVSPVRDMRIGHVDELVVDSTAAGEIQNILDRPSTKVYRKAGFGTGVYYKVIEEDEWGYPAVTYSDEQSAEQYALQMVEQRTTVERFKLYREALDAIEKQVADVEKISEEVNTAISSAVRSIDRIAQQAAQYQKYIDLADGDINIANSFFRELYGQDAEIPTLPPTVTPVAKE